jgi:cobalt/nickel transport system permease protein
LLVLLLAATVLRTLPAAGLALVCTLLLAWVGRLPLRWYLGRLQVLAVLLAFFVIPLPFLMRGDGPAWHLGPLSVSLEGMQLAGLIVCKAWTIVTLVLVILTSAPLDATLKAAHALRVPGLVVQLVLFSYRYLFLLADELARLRIALRVRGYRNRPSWHSYRTVGHVAGTLLVRGYERAERVGQAMRCRGFDGRFRSLVEFRTRWPDVLVFVLLLASAAGLCFLDGWRPWR